MPYLVPRPHTQIDPMAFANAFQGTRDQIRQNRIADMQEQLARQKMEEQTQGRNALSEYLRGPQTDDELAGLAAISPSLATQQQTIRATQGDKQLKRLKDGLEYGLMVLPHVPFELYPAFRQDMLGRNMPAQMLPESFGSKEEYEIWKQRAQLAGIDLGKRLDLQLKELEYDLKKSQFDKPSYQHFQQGDETISTRFTPGTGEVIVGKGPKWSGRELEVDLGDGKSVRFGSGSRRADTGMQKTTANQVEKDLIQQSGVLAELIDVSKAYKPEYQTWEGQMKAGWLGVKEKLPSVFGELPEEQKAWYEDMTNYVAKAGKLMAESYHEVAGAALTETERKMYSKALIDVEKDSPTQAKQKLKNWIEKTRKAVARLNYMRKNGFSIRTALRSEEVPSLESEEVKKELGEMIQQRALEIEKSLAAAGYAVGTAQNQEMTKRQLAEEFGLMQ